MSGRDGLVIHSHSTYVQSIQGGDGGYFAVCSTCGWQAPDDRKTRDEAQTDGVCHEGTTGARWDEGAERFYWQGPTL